MIMHTSGRIIDSPTKSMSDHFLVDFESYGFQNESSPQVE